MHFISFALLTANCVICKCNLDKIALILQESYAMLNKYELLVAREESERVDTLRYSWAKLLSLAVKSC